MREKTVIKREEKGDLGSRTHCLPVINRHRKCVWASVTTHKHTHTSFLTGSSFLWNLFVYAMSLIYQLVGLGCSRIVYNAGSLSEALCVCVSMYVHACGWVHAHAFAVVTEHWMLQRIESPVVSRWTSFFNCRLMGPVCVYVLGRLRLALLPCNHTASLSPTHHQNRTNAALYWPFETWHTLHFG